MGREKRATWGRGGESSQGKTHSSMSSIKLDFCALDFSLPFSLASATRGWRLARMGYTGAGVQADAVYPQKASVLRTGDLS